MAHGADDGILSSRSARRVTRREALRLAGLSGLGMALLSACGQQAPAAKPAETAKPADAAKPAESKPAAPAATTAPAAQQAPAQKPAEAAKPAADAKPAGPAPKDGGVFRIHMATEDPPSLDPYLNVSFRV